MKNQIVISSEPIKPLDPKTYQNVDWGLVVFTVLLAPVALEGFRNIFLAIQNKGKQQQKVQDSKLQSDEKILQTNLASQEAFFASVNQQNAKLLNEILTAREEDIKNLQATQSTMVQVLATVAENLKQYASMATDRSNETRQILDKIQIASERTVIQSMNSHIKLTQVSIQNQGRILDELKEMRNLTKTVVDLLQAIEKQEIK